MENRLAEAFQKGEFVVTYEFIPGRGAVEDAQASLIEEAKELKNEKRVQAFSITDNPSGNPALLADKFGEEIKDLGAMPLVHFTCKDRSRNQIESQLDALERSGIQNLLCMTGDYPVSGWEGRSRPVFDLDSVQLLMMVNAMNEGLPYPSRKGVAHQKPTHFFPGAVTNPFKWTEAETITQYNKLYKKCYAGAKFIISQIGFDVRKMQELLMVMKEQGYGNVPVLANIFVLSAGVGRSMHAGNFPGCYVSDELLAVLQEEAKAEDKGKEARIIRAAKMIAVARGLGYAGVHIGGIGLTPAVATRILDMSEEMLPNWMEYTKELHYGEPGCFYLYEEDPETGLNTTTRSQLAPARTDKQVQKVYKLSRFVHKLIFTPGKKGFPFMQRYMWNAEQKKGTHRKHTIEHTGKAFLYGCMDCGDCGLPSTTYICPMTQCPKCQRNGPCGGSHDGWCEVYPNERLCIHYRAYHRYRRFGEEYKLTGYIVPPNNWDLYGGSAWAGYYLCRDNISRRIYINSDLEVESPHMYKKQIQALKEKKENQK
ncbi:MAG: methylenetetrahydrofolate reductase C-terminal domain-containing protein [Coriobacteriales bacterium]|jgi:methylenetetrahydrofolate reductase (NADPH)